MGKPHARARPIVGSGGVKTPHGIAFYCMLLYLLYKKLCSIWECCVFCALSFRVFTSVVWFRMYGVGVTRYWEVMCEEGRRHKLFHKRFHKVFHEVFHKVLKSIVGSCVRQGAAQSISQSISQSITRYCGVRCEEGRRHTDLRRSVKVPASSACNLHEENQLFENNLNDVPASCSLVSKGLLLSRGA